MRVSILHICQQFSIQGYIPDQTKKGWSVKSEDEGVLSIGYPIWEWGYSFETQLNRAWW